MVALYRSYDRAGRLLYVGITEDVDQRMTEHCRTSGWVDLMHSMTIVAYHDRQAALAAELEAIHTEWPLWNLHGSPFAEVSPRRRWERQRFERSMRPVRPRRYSSRDIDRRVARGMARENRVRRIVDEALGRRRTGWFDCLRLAEELEREHPTLTFLEVLDLAAAQLAARQVVSDGG